MVSHVGVNEPPASCPSPPPMMSTPVLAVVDLTGAAYLGNGTSNPGSAKLSPVCGRLLQGKALSQCSILDSDQRFCFEICN